MATNFHSQLPNDQLHDPKDFSTARKRSVSTKNSSNSVEWVKANYTSSVAITPIADVDGNLHLTYICLYSSNDTNKYAVYFKITEDATLSTPSGYTGVIAIDLTSVGNNATAVQIGANLAETLNAHSDFSASFSEGTGAVTVTGMTSASPADAATTPFTIVVTDTEITGEVLVTDGSGNIKWIDQGDLDVSGGEGDITGVTITTDEGSVSDLTGNVDLTINGGTGINVTVEEGNIITVAESVQRKTKATIDTLLGVSTTNLGEFTGSIIGASRTVKDALQDLETKLGTDATTAIKGVSKFNTSDFTVSSGNVSARHKHVISESLRWETNNLVANESTNHRFTLSGEHTSKAGMIAIEVDLNAMTFPIAARGMVYIRPNTSGTYTFRGASVAGSGTGNNDEFTLYIYKVPRLRSDSSSNYSGVNTNTGETYLENTEVARASITNASSYGNNTGWLANFENSETEGALTLAAGDMLFVGLYYAGEDLDARGQLTMEIEISN
jgi:hypothetical protein